MSNRERDNFTKEASKKEFYKLSIQEQHSLVMAIHQYHAFVFHSNEINDDPRYVFWNHNKQIFNGIDITDFMAIDNKKEFGYACIYYLAKFMNGNK